MDQTFSKSCALLLRQFHGIHKKIPQLYFKDGYYSTISMHVDFSIVWIISVLGSKNIHSGRMFRYSNNYFELVCSIKACASPWRKCSTSPCAFIGGSTQQPLLPLDVYVLYQPVPPQDVYAMLHYSSSWKHIASYAASGRFCSKAAYVAPERTCSPDDCAAGVCLFYNSLCCLEVSFLQHLVLFWSSLS